MTPPLLLSHPGLEQAITEIPFSWIVNIQPFSCNGKSLGDLVHFVHISSNLHMRPIYFATQRESCLLFDHLHVPFNIHSLSKNRRNFGNTNNLNSTNNWILMISCSSFMFLHFFYVQKLLYPLQRQIYLN